MRILGVILIAFVFALTACKGGGGGGLDDPAVNPTGSWDMTIVDPGGTSMGTMTFVKTGSNTWEAPWDDAVDEFMVTLTVSGTSFTLEWVSEWTQNGAECERTTRITGTISNSSMTGSGTATVEVVSGPDPGFDGDVDQLSLTADRLV